jgi:cell division protease FtsH
VHESYEKAKKLLLEHRDKMDLLARRLIEKETIDIEEARVLLMIPEHKLNLHTDTPQNT